jgi:thiosulfate dehydrogenase
MLRTDLENNKDKINKSLRIMMGLLSVALLLMVMLICVVILGTPNPKSNKDLETKKLYVMPDSNFVNLWNPPSDLKLIRMTAEEQEKIKYGRALIAHTSDYLGPKGSVKKMSNGMNCQNCHLKAGTQPWGNNYSAVQANYPKFRERSGTKENQIKRVNDCFQRSLNGAALDSNSREMQSILAYIKWLGADVPIKKVPRGSGLFKLKGMKRACDPILGKAVYEQKCLSCHQSNGQGILAENGLTYVYPPLWGKNSYNIGAGLYRISNLASYVKLNMPYGVTYEKTQLSDQEAWDVAAYINSMPRPTKDLSKDWPNLAGKPFDHPFGPYADPFTEQQHKYGPYKPIKEWKEKHKDLKVKNPAIASL